MTSMNPNQQRALGKQEVHQRIASKDSKMLGSADQSTVRNMALVLAFLVILVMGLTSLVRSIAETKPSASMGYAADARLATE
ncbi:MAG: hypothetical protein CMN57_11605 [Gammaproteobacteria bacterium]|nr:hypothetical protein [Gammaproteobacteria bacterium]